MFFTYAQVRKSSNADVVIDAEDTDVIVASSYASNILPGTLGIKRKKGIFDAKSLTAQEMANVIIRFHVMTWCDSIWSFFGKDETCTFQIKSFNLLLTEKKKKVLGVLPLGF